MYHWTLSDIQLIHSNRFIQCGTLHSTSFVLGQTTDMMRRVSPGELTYRVVPERHNSKQNKYSTDIWNPWHTRTLVTSVCECQNQSLWANLECWPIRLRACVCVCLRVLGNALVWLCMNLLMTHIRGGVLFLTQGWVSLSRKFHQLLNWHWLHLLNRYINLTRKHNFTIIVDSCTKTT